MARFSVRLGRMAALTLVLLGYGAPAGTAVTHGAQGPGGQRFSPGEIVVKLTTAQSLGGVATAFHLDPAPLGQFGSRPIYRLRILDGARPEQVAAALLRDRRVVYAEPNVQGQAPESRQDYSWAVGGDVGGYTAQWASAVLRLPEALSVTRGAGVTVAVLDTGVDRTHPLLKGRLVKGYDFVDMDADPSEVGVRGKDRGFGHGTHVAGLIALTAPEAKIMPIRVLDQQGVGNVWVLAEALAYAVNPDGNPATHDGADVINLSLSTFRESHLLRDVLKNVTCPGGDTGSGDQASCFSPGYGAVIIDAAGNSGSTTPEYPAGNGERGTLSVGASTQADTLAAFSNRGSWVSVAAPGDHMLSSVPGGGYGVWSGTSMAAPVAAGVAALVRAVNPGLSTDKVVQRLVSSSARIAGAVPRRLDAAAAVGLGQTPGGKSKGSGRHTSELPSPQIMLQGTLVALHRVRRTGDLALTDGTILPLRFGSDAQTRVLSVGQRLTLAASGGHGRLNVQLVRASTTSSVGHAHLHGTVGRLLPNGSVELLGLNGAALLIEAGHARVTGSALQSTRGARSGHAANALWPGQEVEAEVDLSRAGTLTATTVTVQALTASQVSVEGTSTAADPTRGTVTLRNENGQVITVTVGTTGATYQVGQAVELSGSLLPVSDRGSAIQAGDAGRGGQGHGHDDGGAPTQQPTPAGTATSVAGTQEPGPAATSASVSGHDGGHDGVGAPTGGQNEPTPTITSEPRRGQTGPSDDGQGTPPASTPPATGLPSTDNRSGKDDAPRVTPPSTETSAPSSGSQASPDTTRGPSLSATSGAAPSATSTDQQGASDSGRQPTPTATAVDTATSAPTLPASTATSGPTDTPSPAPPASQTPTPGSHKEGNLTPTQAPPPPATNPEATPTPPAPPSPTSEGHGH